MLRNGEVLKARNYAAAATKYAEDVVSGKIDACKWVRLASQRHLNDVKRSEKPRTRWPYIFDEAKASRICLFIEHLPHVKGKWALVKAGESNHITLEPWQCFILCSIFGWVDKKTRLRRFRRAEIRVPRKNGKSILAAGVGLFMFAADGEPGAEVYCAATNEEQAWEVFRPAKEMMERHDKLREKLGIKVATKRLTVPKKGCRFHAVTSRPRDGAMAHCYIEDEKHELKDDMLRDAYVMGMGAREQPLEFGISTAGVNQAGPCFATEKTIQKILEGTVEDDTIFGIIYTLDADDDWTTEASLRKANPNFGVSVFADYLLNKLKEAIRESRKQNIFKTKHLDLWQNASSAWMNMQRWNECADPVLTTEEFIGEECVVSADVSSKIDLTSGVRLFRRLEEGGRTHYYAFWRHWLPEEKAEAPENQHYQGWVKDGWITKTDYNAIDFELVQDTLADDVEATNAECFVYDPWNAEQLSQGIARQTGCTRVELRQNVENLSPAMKLLEALVVDKRFHFNGDPVATWAMSNVVAHLDKKSNLFPGKEQPENKIDPMSALFNALSQLPEGDAEEFIDPDDFFEL